ncbi:MAG: sigma-70 family RNA polymerase sigma factor [Dysgonamonadaceae bacterium]|jgi:RNA polymerase sigma factor (sigma-70 family)|nr:sigma-70 family RNA polymerase sigma factor [Dysgonamonadaceae bacterium]
MKTSQSKQSESDLWDEFRLGNRLAFARIYELHIQKLYLYGLKLSTDKGFVMDCIHDLFVELYRNRKTIGATGNIPYYLIRSLRNKMNYHLARQHESIEDYPLLSATLSCEQPVDEQDFTDYKRRCLLSVVNQLSDRQKEIIYLRYFANFSNEEIAGITGINYQSVRNILSRTLKILRERIPKRLFVWP